MGNTEIDDQTLIEAFEALTLEPGRLSHREHVRLAWLHLRRWGLLETLERLGRGLRRFAATQGAPEKYHETVTWAWVLLIHERMARDREHPRGAAASWRDFAARHPELLAAQPPLLGRYYRPETLASELARRTFVLPDAAF